MLITKRFEFSYAHILPNHSGKCKRLHGHNGVLEVTVSGEPHGDETYEGVRPPRSDEGMVIDFGDLKQIVKDVVVDQWDHRFLAKGDEWPAIIGSLMQEVKQFVDEMLSPRMKGWLGPLLDIDLSDQIVRVGVRTTAENLAKLSFGQIIHALSNPPLLESVKFYETPDSWAEYTLQDYYKDHSVKEDR